MRRRSFAVASVVALLAGLSGGVTPAIALTGVTVNIDGSSPNGRTSDGVGTISAGGESRLIQFYRNPQFTQILDFAFCSPLSASSTNYCVGPNPKYGASAQELKVEIGSDSNSSVGTEAGFLRTQTEYNALRSAINAHDHASEVAACHLPTSDSYNSPTFAAFWGRGYNWRLMREALFRNNEMTFGALPWDYPDWVFSGTGDFFTTSSRNYLLAFAFCANLNGTPLDNVGVWNEANFTTSPDPTTVPYDQLTMQPELEPWLINLRNDLNNSASTWDGVSFAGAKLVCCDEPGYWSPLARDMKNNVPAGIQGAVQALNPHYVNPISNPDARYMSDNYGTLIWAGEVGSLDAYSDYWSGARNQAQFYERPYIVGAYSGMRLVATLGSYLRATDNTYWNHPSNGMIQAEQPWGGYYYLPPAVWAMAQFTQFTKRGTWRYIDESSCEFNDAETNIRCAAPYSSDDGYAVSYATLREASGQNWSTVIETMNATQNHTFNLCPINGAYAPTTVHIWKTNLANNSLNGSWFTTATLTKAGGCYTTTLNPSYIYTVTTLTTGAKGTYSAPAARPIDRPDLDGTFTNRVGTGAAYNDGETPEYWSDMWGAFVIRKSGSSYATGCPTTDPCVEMAAPARSYVGRTFTLIGQWDDFSSPNNWCNYSTQVAVKFPVANPYPIGGLMMDLVPDTSGGYSALIGYEFRIDNLNQWELKTINTGSLDGSADVTVRHGTFSTQPDSRGYHVLKLVVVNTTVTPYIDGVHVFQSGLGDFVDSSAHNCGFVGLSTNNQIADFDDLTIVPN